MARFRVLMGHKVPTDHLIDVENVPASFLKTLDVQLKQNWIHPDKPEYNVEYKANQWEDLQAMITKFNRDAKTPEPACIVQTDDAERARILPPNLRDENVPKIVLTMEPEKHVEPAAVKPSFVCPHCDFEGKTRVDIEGHVQEKHGEDPAVRSLAGKSVGEPKSATVYACFECGFEAPDKEVFMKHGIDHLKQKTIVPEIIHCGISGCEFKTSDSGKMRGHRVGAHRKQKVSLGA